MLPRTRAGGVGLGVHRVPSLCRPHLSIIVGRTRGADCACRGTPWKGTRTCAWRTFLAHGAEMHVGVIILAYCVPSLRRPDYVSVIVGCGTDVGLGGVVREGDVFRPPPHAQAAADARQRMRRSFAPARGRCQLARRPSQWDAIGMGTQDKDSVGTGRGLSYCRVPSAATRHNTRALGSLHRGNTTRAVSASAYLGCCLMHTTTRSRGPGLPLTDATHSRPLAAAPRIRTRCPWSGRYVERCGRVHRAWRRYKHAAQVRVDALRPAYIPGNPARRPASARAGSRDGGAAGSCRATHGLNLDKGDCRGTRAWKTDL
ncbi:hypothetical protein B0H17DRAFT_67900 [Mycena rosella]|uniref:Uncharacterized protein n=1 Tax=Mycena rosella TaxID=1033263 RepID=A0AAD7GRK8_MYCRO|nr:hypothetical protein B0H17DRAFT_67900 [Mycena rosella]